MNRRTNRQPNPQIRCYTFRCSVCQRQRVVWFTVLISELVVTCAACGHSAKINVARLLQAPEDLQVAVAQAGKANGVVM
jgi:transcription elongation factor Elf1